MILNTQQMLCICIFLEISIITTFSLTVLKMGGGGGGLEISIITIFSLTLFTMGGPKRPLLPVFPL